MDGLPIQSRRSVFAWGLAVFVSAAVVSSVGARWVEPLESCKKEWVEHCKGEAMGSGGVLACLLDHADLAGPECGRALAITRERIELGDRIHTCRRSMRKLCPPEADAEGVLLCLDRKRAELSNACRLQLDEELSGIRVCDPGNPPIPI